jgi:caffeoyl-CoA O-methyltransferase
MVMADPKSFHLTGEIHTYLLDHSSALDEVQRDLIAETTELGGVSIMQISPEQGLFMTMLTRLIGARDAVEIGTFTGFSSLAIARGLPADGTLLCCDISEEWTSVARRFWQRAGVDDKVTLSIGPAAETLAALPLTEQFDLAFIDADKPGYLAYYEELVPRMRPGGVILVDNVLYFGAVVDPAAADENVVAIRAFNDHARADDRVDTVMLAIGDGLTFITRRTPSAL